MEGLGILKYWRNSSAGDHEVNGAAFVTDKETDKDDSFFDLVFKSPASCEGGDAGSKKDFDFIESPRDVFLSKNEFMTSKPPSPAVTLLRSTPKFRVFMLGFKRTTKCEKVDQSCGELKASPSNQSSKSSKTERRNRFPVKFGAEETPILSALGRENSLRSRLLIDEDDDGNPSAGASSVKSIPKYLKLIRSFQMKASKKAKVANSVTPSHSPVTAPVNLYPSKFTVGSRSVGSFKIVTRNLVKSRSASATSSSMSLPPPSVRRRDDSLLEQHDGIQGAILHCKKSYNSSAKDRSSSGNSRKAYDE
ncbi:putative membrane-associated kinase regulator 2 [Dorcoceras hygrometricum]|uniref:Putative membrane-associated kinase regulator 2 n=1 Tax=Dorcoceras hygrometricum TaxID=472368 RepID=A0A2Z7D955_9LAMI|nr:putative membrane-associated kinase regulator 2 [Dorcoceras hygrometricum]